MSLVCPIGPEANLLEATPAHAARLFVARGWAAEVLVWSGVAVWSADQLLAEISRGSWVLAPAAWGDASASSETAWRDVVARRGTTRDYLPEEGVL